MNFLFVLKNVREYIIQIYTSDTEFDILEFDSFDEALENLEMIPFGKNDYGLD